MRVFNIAIIGYGGFGKFLHTWWSHLEQIRIVAIADPTLPRSGNDTSPVLFTDWQEMIRLKDIDLIAIVTEPASHKHIATACMEAGKHVLIEKPLAVTMPDAQEIIRVRDKTKTIAGIDYVMRFNPLINELANLIQQGIFGKLRRASVENYAQDETLDVNHWFWDTDRSGGILIEHAVHFIDLIHFLAPAQVVAVNGLKHNRNTQMEDQVMANVLYEDGLMATHYHAFSRPGFFETTKIKLAFDLADVEIHGWIPLQADIKVLVNARSRETLLDSELFELHETTSVENAVDESRPKGWGKMQNTVTEMNSETPGYTIRSSGIPYEVEEIVQGIFRIGLSKQEVYAMCVQSSLLDVLKKIENPGHQLVAPLESGLISLDVAIRATRSARQGGQ